MSSENSLEFFQQKIMATMDNANVTSDAFVAISLDDDYWLIDLMFLKEASVPPRISKSIGAPSWAIGIANFKGAVWTIVDMRVLIKNEVTVNPKWGWVTLLRPPVGFEEQRFALLWTEIVQIAPKKEYALDPHAQPEQWCKGKWVDKNGKVWKELDVTQLIGANGLIENWQKRLIEMEALVLKVK